MPLTVIFDSGDVPPKILHEKNSLRRELIFCSRERMMILLKDFPPPHIYRREGQPTYFDPVRKKYVLVTPRETVRQRVVPYLIQELNIPQRMIRIGEKLSFYGLNFRHRADIVIERFDREENILRPLAVVECKAIETPLDEAAFNETFDYAEKLGCDYCLLTNGDASFSFYLGADNYVELETLPTYGEMLKGFTARRQNAGEVS